MDTPTPRSRPSATALVALVAGLLLLTLLPRTDAAAQTPPPEATAVLDWTMPDRYDGQDVTDRFDTDHDGYVEHESVRHAMRDFLYPQTWHVDLHGCDSIAPSTIIDHQWQVFVNGEWDTIETSECETSYEFPAEGDYPVTLTVVTDNGQTATSTRTVRVNDVLIVGMGDSYGSGEGNPDIEAPDRGGVPSWDNPRCHRSRWADQAVAARRMERTDPRSSVTFIHVACSGAQISEPDNTDVHAGGLLSPYFGVLEPWEVGSTTPLPSQMDQLRGYLDGDDADRLVDREVDVVILSGGGNDVNFGPILMDCAIPSFGIDCQDGTAGDLFESGLPQLEGRLMALSNAFADVGVDRHNVYQREYPDPTWETPNRHCSSMLVGIEPREVVWAGETVARALNDEIREFAEARWNFVDGIADGYRGVDEGIAHGDCAPDRWYRWLLESFEVQDDHLGTMHPNRAGHHFQGNRIFDVIEENLTEGHPEVVCTPTASLDLTQLPDGTYQATDTSTTDCGWQSERYWQLDGQPLGSDPVVTVQPAQLRCGSGRLQLTVASPTGQWARETRTLTGPFGVPTVESPVYGASTVNASATNCGMPQVVVSGYPAASVGSPACLADPNAFVQAGPTSLGCPDGWDQSGFARGEQSTATLDEQLVMAADGRDDAYSSAGLVTEGRYEVVAPEGTTVEAHVVLDVSVAMNAVAGANCPAPADCATSGAPLTTHQASLGNDLRGELEVLRPLDSSPDCPPDAGCDPELASLTLVDWSLAGFADACEACNRSPGGGAFPVPYDHFESWEQALRVHRTEVGSASEPLLDEWTASPIETPDGLDRTTDVELGEQGYVTRRTVTVPVTLRAGDVVDTRQRGDVSGNVDGWGRTSSHVGSRVRIEVLTGDASIVPVTAGQVVDATDAVVNEGDDGTTTVTVPVSLAQPATETTTVDWRLVEDTASRADFARASGTVTFAPGDSVEAATVKVKGDLVDEPDESLRFELSSAVGATVGRSATVTIVDDDAAPVLGLGDLTLDEGPDGTRVAKLTVSLSNPASYDIPISWRTRDGTATSGSDYRARVATTTVKAGSRQAVLSVTVNGDRDAEGDEALAVEVLGTGDSGVAVPNHVGTITIRDDEAASGLRVGDATVVEGTDGTRSAFVVVSLPTAASTDLTLSFDIVGDTASAGDVKQRTTSVRIRKGSTTALVPVVTYGDRSVEADETALVRLRTTGMGVDDGTGTVTIRDAG